MVRVFWLRSGWMLTHFSGYLLDDHRRVGRMQQPPAAWHHGGLPRLGALLRWVDLESRRKEEG